jgi:hypothetical protein
MHSSSSIHQKSLLRGKLGRLGEIHSPRHQMALQVGGPERRSVTGWLPGSPLGGCALPHADSFALKQAGLGLPITDRADRTRLQCRCRL